MSSEEYPGSAPHETDIGQRLKAAREKCRKTPLQIIASGSITVDSYLDLEGGHNWFRGTALKEICSLAQAVGLTTAELLFGRTNDATDTVTFEGLKATLIEWLYQNHVTLGAFEEQIGCEVRDFLKEASAANHWNIDCLRAVCKPIGVDWSQVSLCQEEYPRPQLRAMSFGAIVRDVGIVFALMLTGGFLIGLSGIISNPSLYKVLTQVSNLFSLVIGFTIVGGLVGANRWKHLFTVAALIWALNVVNFWLITFTIKEWFLQLPLILFLMGIGGALSYCFRRRQSRIMPESPDQPVKFESR